MKFIKCEECGSDLTQEMIQCNMCWECGHAIIKEPERVGNLQKGMNKGEKDTSSLMKDEIPEAVISEEDDGDKSPVLISNVLHCLGIILLIFGTIGNFIFASIYDRFSFGMFFMAEFSVVLSGFIVLAFSAIIKLLLSIDHKIK